MIPSYAQRSLCSIVHHAAWQALLRDCRTADFLASCRGETTVDREATRLISCSMAHAGDWLNVLSASARQPSHLFVIAMQRRFGLTVSSAAAFFDARAAEGRTITGSDRLGDALANAANHSRAHKQLCWAWRDAEACASAGDVYLGDKKLGLLHYAEYCDT